MSDFRALVRFWWRGRVVDAPAHATIRGVGAVLDELDFLSKKARRHRWPSA